METGVKIAGTSALSEKYPAEFYQKSTCQHTRKEDADYGPARSAPSLINLSFCDRKKGKFR